VNSFLKAQEVKGRFCRSRMCLYFSATVAMIMCFLLGSCSASAQAQLSSQPPAPFVESADYDRAVPSPESVTGHGVGERPVRYPALVRYLKALAESSDRVTITSYGRTHEGRELYYLTITSRANHQRLDRIKTDNAKLSDPRQVPSSGQSDRHGGQVE